MSDAVFPMRERKRPTAPRLPIPIAAIPAWTMIVTMAATAAAIIGPSPLSYDGAALDTVWLFFLSLDAIGALLRRRGLVAIGSGAELVAMFMLLSLLASFASAALAWTALPLADDTLRAIDASFGFSWTAMIAAARGQAHLLTVLSYIYVSLGIQPLLLVMLLCATRRQEFAWRFVTAWGVALMLTLAIFPFAPALGNFATSHIAWGAIPGIRVPSGWTFPRTLTAIRDGSMTLMGDDALGGIIAFPSFHTAGAVMLAWGFLPFRHLRVPMIALNLAMIASALVIGGHYLVDIVAGIAAAIVAIVIADRLAPPAVKMAERSPG